MNRFVSRKSALFVLFGWFLASALFADGANLDDLVGDTLVLHDDDEVASAPNVELDGWSDPGTTSQGKSTPQAPPTKENAAKPSPNAPAPPVRVVVDQDSPSLAADSRLHAFFDSRDIADQIIAVRKNPPTRDALYLQFCTLLI